MWSPLLLGMRLHLVSGISRGVGSVANTLLRFGTSNTCPSCRKVLFNINTLPAQWPSRIPTFGLGLLRLDFEMDRDAVTERLWEYDRLEDCPYDEDSNVLVIYQAFTTAMVGAMILERFETNQTEHYGDWQVTARRFYLIVVRVSPKAST